MRFAATNFNQLLNKMFTEAGNCGNVQPMFGTKQQRECTPLHNKGRGAASGLAHPEGLEPRIHLDERSSETEADACGTSDLLIRGLVNRLPTPDSTWSLDNRAKWLRTAASIFGLVYKASENEHREISIDLAREQIAVESGRTPEAKDGQTKSFPPL